MTSAQYARIIAAPFAAASWGGIDVTKAQYDGIIAAIGAAGMAIGSAITGGTAGRVLFEGAGPVLADASGFRFDEDGFTVLLGALSMLVANSGIAAAFSDGVRLVSVCDGTNHVSYAAGNAAKWAASAPPTDVWVALDRIAVALTTLLTPP